MRARTLAGHKNLRVSQTADPERIQATLGQRQSGAAWFLTVELHTDGVQYLGVDFGGTPFARACSMDFNFGGT